MLSYLYKFFKQLDIIDMFDNTPLYLDDLFTNRSSEFEKHIPHIYPAELQLNRAYTSNQKNISWTFKYSSNWE